MRDQDLKVVATAAQAVMWVVRKNWGSLWTNLFSRSVGEKETERDRERGRLRSHQRSEMARQQDWAQRQRKDRECSILPH